MKLVQTIKELQSELNALRSEGKTIGLVPTMGACRTRFVGETCCCRK